MKRLLSLFAIISVLGAAFGCSEDYPEPDANGLPSVANLSVSHVIGDRNMVTFTIAQESGIIPYFIFPDGTQEVGFTATKQFREEGDYTIEIKAYNANGVSDGSKTYTFNVPETYVDPFDPTEYISYLTGGSSKTWVIAQDEAGHMGCGQTWENPTEWWSAAAGDKADWSVYDNQLTFSSDGTFKFDPVDGQIYVNTGATYESSYNTNDGNDYLAPCDVIETTYTLSGSLNDNDEYDLTLTFPANTTIGYISADSEYANPTYHITEISASRLVLVYENTGISWQYIFVPYNPNAGKVEGYVDYDSSDNLWYAAGGDAAGHTISQWYADASWSTRESPEVTEGDGKYTWTYPLSTASQWQAQFFITPASDLALSADKTYDFLIKMTLSQNVSAVTIKLTDTTNDGIYLFTKNEDLSSGITSAISYKGLAGIDAASVKLVLDFGGCPDNTEVTIESIILQEAQ